MANCDTCECVLDDDEVDTCDGCRWSIEEIDEEIEAGPKHPCSACGGEGILLGTLGDITHYRCRRCGWNFAEIANG